jgi:hypothetical protein
MRKALLLAFVVVACSKDPPPQTPTETAASVTPAASSAPVASAGPVTTASAPVASASVATAPKPPEGPSLQEETTGASVDQWKLVVKGLPALSEDGTRIAYVVNEQDGMRGYPNHKLVLKTVATDAVEKKLVLFDANALDKAERAKKLDDERKKATTNVGAARDALAATKWISLAAATGARGKPFTGGELAVELSSALKLSVTDKAGKKLVDFDAKGWKARAAAPCAFTPTLDGVWIAADKKVVAAGIVHMVTAGGDSCNLSDEVHVLAWK